MTQQLATVVQSIQVEGRTGLLMVRRGQGDSREEGTILFTNGKMQEARAGKRTSFAAFKYLCTWESYESSFRTPDGQTRLFTQSSPSTYSASMSPITPIPVQNDPPTPTTPTAPQTDPLNFTIQPLTDSFTIDPYASIPCQSGYSLATALQIIENAGLTRAHRRLFLLINGERSIRELARITTSNEFDIYQKLQDIEKTKIVYFLPDS